MQLHSWVKAWAAPPLDWVLVLKARCSTWCNITLNKNTNTTSRYHSIRVWLVNTILNNISYSQIINTMHTQHKIVNKVVPTFSFHCIKLHVSRFEYDHWCESVIKNHSSYDLDTDNSLVQKNISKHSREVTRTKLRLDNLTSGTWNKVAGLEMQIAVPVSVCWDLKCPVNRSRRDLE